MKPIQFNFDDCDHVKGMDLQVKVFKGMIDEFDKLGENCPYDWTKEKIVSMRESCAKYVLNSLKIIRKADDTYYKAIKLLYHSELQEVVKVARELRISKN